MPQTYCSCVCAGKNVRMALDLNRPGKYVCIGCGAPEEAVLLTTQAMDDEWIKNGRGFGFVPESLIEAATIIENEPGGPKILPYKEMWVEGQADSGRTMAELVQKHKEIATDAGVEV